jgi:hypothetical protein
LKKCFYDDRERRWKSNRQLTIRDILDLLPAGFGWVLAAFVGIAWYLAYKVMIAPPPGLRRNPSDVRLWMIILFTNGAFVWVIVVKLRRRRWDRRHPPPRDFGD